MVVMLALFGSLILCLLDLALWWRASHGAVLGATADSQSVPISPLDADVLLFDAWKLAVQLIRVLQLLDVELRLEGPELREGVSGHCARGLVIVVDEAEDRVEFLECSWEERHGWFAGVEG